MNYNIKLKFYFLLILFFSFMVITYFIFNFLISKKQIIQKNNVASKSYYTKFKNVKLNIKKTKYIIKPKDNLIKLLSVYLKKTKVYHIIKSVKQKFDCCNIKAGHTLFYIFQNKKLIGIEYYKDKKTSVYILFKNNDLTIKEKDIPYKIKQTIVEGIIKNNLFDSIIEYGEKPKLAVLLAEIFAWDIDFVHDIRQGDGFKIIVEKKYLDGKFIDYGKILAAQMKVKNKIYDAYWYQSAKNEEGGYYNSEGIPLEKVFLRAPLKFTYISSRYSYRRFHPILKVFRPHLGIDFAAPIGTPIKTVADGVVIRKGYDREGGNFVKIRHKNGYITIYNHMSRFAKGLRVGKKVKQGDIIGYVGTTGLSTGPHLDFRVIKNGKFINPLKLPSIPKKRLCGIEKKIFLSKIKPLIAILKDEKKIAKLKNSYSQSETH